MIAIILLILTLLLIVMLLAIIIAILNGTKFKFRSDLVDTLSKIKSVLSSDLSAYELEKRTGVTRPSIVNMRKDTYDFSKMSFQIGEKLANYYDEQRESTLVFKDQGAFLSFTSTLDQFMKDTIKEIVPESITDEAMKEVLVRVNSEILKDSYLLEELYTVYKDALRKKQNS